MLVYASSQISDSVLTLTVMILAFFLLDRLEQHFSLGWVAALAACLGVFILCRSEAILYLPCLLVWCWLRFPARRVQAVLVLSLTCCAALAPWVIRNGLVFHQVSMNTTGGVNLWEGQNRDAAGVPSWYVEPVSPALIEIRQQVNQIPFDSQFEVNQDRLYLQHALADVVHHPAHTALTALKKFLFYWSGVYFGGNITYPGIRSPLYWLPWLAVLPFFIAGLVQSLRGYRRYLFFYVYLLVSTLTTMVFFALPRYTLYIYPWVFLFAASGLWSTGLNLVRHAGLQKRLSHFRPENH